MRNGLINAGLLAAGLALTFLAQGAHPTDWAAVAGALLLLCYLDRAPARLGLLVLLPLFLATYCLAWFGVVPRAPVAIYAAIVVVYGVPYFLPFVAHRLLAGGGPAWMRVLVFPCAWASVEYALQAFSPYGAWMSLAYSQDAGGLAAQLATLGGAPLVAFFLTAIASAAAWIVGQAGRSPARAAAYLLGLVLVVGAVLGWAEWRIQAYRPGRTVTVASVIADPAAQDAANTAMVDADLPLSPHAREVIRAATDTLNRKLLLDTAQSAAAGARIVAWPEASGMVRDGDEQDFLRQAADVARARRIYLFPAYIVWRPGQPKSIENKVAAIDPSGHVAWMYWKAHPIVVLEDAHVVRGRSDLGTLDTPYGRIGLAICHDLDFPEPIRGAARGVDLLIDPSNDWTAIEWLHADMHRYRALENGVPLFRPTDHGAGLVADRIGRVQLWRRAAHGSGAFVFTAPIGATPTPYSAAGGWLAWVAGLVLASAVAARMRSAFGARRKSASPASGKT